MTSRLPDEIAYLGPAIDELLLLDEEDIGEETDTTTLVLALKARIVDLDDDAAIARLTSDRAVLSDWLSRQAAHPALFVEAYLEPGIEMVNSLRSFESPDAQTKIARQNNRGRIEMDGPSGIEGTRVQGALLFHSEDFAVAMMILPSQSYQQHVGVMREAKLDGEPINAGNIKGQRYKVEGKILYYLSVDDQIVQVSVEAFRNTERAEKALLRVLPSLRIE